MIFVCKSVDAFFLPDQAVSAQCLSFVFFYLFVILPSPHLSLCSASFCCLIPFARLQTTTLRVVLRVLGCLCYAPDLPGRMFLQYLLSVLRHSLGFPAALWVCVLLRACVCVSVTL